MMGALIGAVGYDIDYLFFGGVRSNNDYYAAAAAGAVLGIGGRLLTWAAGALGKAVSSLRVNLPSLIRGIPGTWADRLISYVNGMLDMASWALKDIRSRQ